MFELNGKKYSTQQLKASANKQGLSFEDLLSAMKNRGMVEVTESKPNSFTSKDPIGNSNKGIYNPAASTDSIKSIVPGSSQQEKIETIDYSKSTEKSILDIGKEYYEGMLSGYATGRVSEEYLEVFKGNHSPEAIDAMLKAGQELNKLPQNDRMNKYIQAVDDAGGGLWNGMIELANTDGLLVASQVALQSMAMMFGAVVDSGVDLANGKTPDVLGYMAAGAGVGASGGALLGSAGFTTGLPGFATTAAGAVTGTAAGAMGGLSTALENGLTFTELLKEEIEAEGGTYDKKGIAKFLGNDEKYKDIRNKALKRGLTIGAIDMITGGIAGSVGVKTGRVVSSVLGPRMAMGVGIAAGTAVEGLGGAVGEFAGQKAGGQEFNAADIILEAFAEMPVAGVTVVPKVLMNKPKYTITENKQEIKYTKEQFLEQIEGLNDESIAMLDIDIKNDPALAEELFNRQNDFVLRSRIDDRVPEERRTELVELEKKRQVLSKQSKLTGLFAKPNAKENLLNIEGQMKDIIDSYANVDRRTKDVRARRKSAQNVNNARKKILMDRIQTGVEKSKAYEKMDISIANVADPKEAAQMRLDQEEKSAMYDMGLLEAELANTTDPAEAAKIQSEIEAIEKGVEDVRGQMSEAENAYGFLLEDSQSGKMKIVINDKKAIAGGDGAINVAAHEFLHAVLNKGFNTKSNNYAVKTARGLGATVGGSLFQYMKTLDSGIATNSFMGRLLNYAEAGQETMGQEVLTLMSDALVDGSFKPNDTVLNKIGDMFATFFESVGLKKVKFGEAKDVYRFIKNYNKSVQGNKMAGRVVQNAMRQGGKLIATEKGSVEPGSTTRPPMSKSAFEDEQVVDELGLGKETIGIVAKNTLIENQILQENLRDSDGNVMASPAMQRALASNNLPRAFALARQAANRGNDLTLEEGLKINNVQDFFSEYSLKLVELARTYRAEKDGKRVPFGAYMNTLLPKKYAGILDKLKGKIETSSMSDENTAKAVGKKASTVSTLASTEVEGKVVALSSIDQGGVQQSLVEQVTENDTKLYKYKDVKSELTAHNKFMADGTLITPELKAQYKKDGKKPPKELKSLREPTGQLYGGLEAVSDIFGKDLAIRILKEQDLTTEQRKAVQDKILQYFPQIIAMMPYGTTASGDATGIANTGLGVFYKKLARTKMKNTGTGKGLANQQKQYIDSKMFKAMAGLVPGARVNNTSVDGFLRAVIVQVASIANNQAIRQAHGPAVLSLKDGKASTMFAKGAKENSNATMKDVDNGLTAKMQQKENGSWPSISEIHKQVMVDMKTEFGRQDLEQWLFEGNGKQYLVKSFLTNSGNFTGTTASVKDKNGVEIGRKHTKNLLYRNVPELKEKINLELDKEALIQHKKDFKDLSAEQKASVESKVFPADSKYTAQELTDISNVFKKVQQTDANLTDTEFKESKARGFELLWRSFDQMIEDNPANGKYILALLSSSSSQQRAFMRTGSTFGFVNTLDEASIEEHTLAASDFAKFLYNRLMERNLFGDFNFFEKAVQSYFQGSLPLRMDNNLVGTGFTYKDSAGKYSWDVYLGLKPIWIRYINPDVNGNNGGVDPNAIKLANGNTLAEEYGVGVPAALRTPSVIAQQQEILFNIFNEINIDKRAKLVSTASKAINSFAKVKVKADAVVGTKLMAAKSVSPMSKEVKGITVLDFDDTLATSNSLIRFTKPDGTKGTLNAEQYAKTYEQLTELGYKWDFSEFNEVVDGKTAPLFNKAMKLQGKFGPENMFVLTARPAGAANAIFEFLKANGLNIPVANITGLGNSTGQAKANWMAGKVAEGYNDFYFADDAIQNVEAVKNMLDQFDVKSKVQQAKVNFSKGIDTKFNDILESTTGIESKKRFSAIKARKRGSDKGKFRVFIPPSHEDFVGLLYNFLGKGKEGNAQMRFFEDALVKPLNRAYREIDTAKQAIARDYKALNKEFADVKSKLKEKTIDGDFTNQDAIRVYLWNKHGHAVPGLTETDQQSLVDTVMEDSGLKTYADTLNVISKQETYVAPTEGWEGGDIRMDLMAATGRVGRKQYLSEFNENAEIMFSEENMNKIEAAYGANFRSALEDMLHRIKTGVNRPKGQSATVNKYMNYLNGSVGSVMFLNMRSAALQQMSIVNYLNFADNNIVMAAAAFANQPQYWKDFAFIYNSDMLKERRGGIGNDVNGADLAEAVKKSRNPIGSVIGKMLQLGFTPTQIGDSLAISIGGASYLRNRINKYVKDGLSTQEAEAAAFTDFQDLTQSTQQSARPDMTSQQQSSWIGKIVLNFQNITSQYNRLIKKAGLDILNRRITSPNSSQMQSDMSNASRILYYGAVQNIVFYSLQTALFALAFGTDDEDDDKKAEQLIKKKDRVIHGTIDSILRGSGIYGAIVSTLKNMVIKWNEQRDKKYNPDESAVIMEMLNFSPVIGIKARKMVNAEKTLNYNKKVIKEMETFDIDNPMWSAVTNYTEAITTAPVNRIHTKVINTRNALDNQYTAFQRFMFLFGYSTWSLNLGDTDKMKDVKQSVKDKAKKSKKKTKKKTKNKSIFNSSKSILD